MSNMADVLATHRIGSYRIASHTGSEHMPDIGVYESRCAHCGPIKGSATAHQAAALSAAGFGPVKEARAEALEAAADHIMGPSENLRDGATCRDIAQELRTRAASERLDS